MKSSSSQRVIARVWGAVLLGMLPVLYLSQSLWLPAMYSYLDVSEVPHNSEVIVLLGGGDGRRQQFAAELYTGKYASMVIATGNPPSVDYAVNQLIAHGIPQDAIWSDVESSSTYDEAHRVHMLLLQREARSAIIVTDQTHTRRARATYLNVFDGSEIQLTFVAPEDGMDPHSWWYSSQSELIWSEYAKILYYALAFGIWPR